MGSKNILLFGLQRSGSNFLETLLLKNYRVKICNDNKVRKGRYVPSQKHFRLYDEKELVPEPKYENDLIFKNFKEYEHALGLKKEIDGVLVISKDPYSWLLSYRNWARKNNWPPVDYHYVEEYNKFYRKWFEFNLESDKIILLRYQDFLVNTEKELKRIEEKFELELTFLRRLKGNRVLKLDRVGQSKNFTTGKFNYYLNKEYLNDYQEGELEAIDSKIDTELLQNLGYQKNT